MIYLLLSILCNASIYLLFKWFDKLHVQIFPAIVINYTVAFALGFSLVPDLDIALQGASQFPPWLVGGLLLGVVFIAIFYLMAITAQRVGVSVTTIASKMSLALAVLLFAVSDHNERITAAKAIAILLALGGVIFSSLKSDGNSFKLNALIWPIIILFGSTIIDFSIAYFSKFPANDSELRLYACLSFAMAGTCGLVIVIWKTIKGSLHIHRRDVAAGFLLGIVNYGSIFFLVKSYSMQILPMSSLLPINNLGVVLVGVFAALILFKERLTKLNWLGIAFSVIALALLVFE